MTFVNDLPRVYYCHQNKGLVVPMHIFSGTVQYNFVWFVFLKIALFRDFPGCTSFAIVRLASDCGHLFT